MVPGQSWNAQMELEHWNRYVTFSYLAESMNVLDVACGEGYGTHLLSLIATKAVGIDLSAENINHAMAKYAFGKDNLEYVVGDACNLPVKSHTVNVVYSFETIEHLNDVSSFLSNLSRVISDQGVGIISTPQPNINPVSNKPFNPYHIHELSHTEFRGCLSNHFDNVALVGQSREFPHEVHRAFDSDKDAYVIGIVSKDRDVVEGICRRLPDRKTTSIREDLFRRHFNRMKNFAKPLRILFVPLTNTNCCNPSDRRRVFLPANYLRECGAEIAVVNKEDALNIRSDVVYCQDRDYEFWLNNIDGLRERGTHLVFSFSDALGVTSRSKAHDFAAFSGKEELIDAFVVCENLRLFLERCCSHVFAGSHVQKEIISNMVPDVTVSVLPDPIDTETYNTDLVGDIRFDGNENFTLIWEGFCDNVPYMLVCADAIRRLSKRIALTVVVVSSKTRRNKFLGTVDNEELARTLLGDIVEFHTWDTKTIAELMAKSHVGLAPLFMDCQFAKAKPANKAIIYNYMKLPVIASPTVEYRLYVQNNLNGFIANTEKDWEEYIEYLYKNPEERARIGEYGHKKAKVNYSLDAISKQMLRVFLTLV